MMQELEICVEQRSHVYLPIVLVMCSLLQQALSLH